MIAFGRVRHAPLVVFADFDHTFLDDRRCAALPEGALHELHDRCIPVVWCSKRTRGEIERIRRVVGVDDPFICEDGAVLYVPAGYGGFQVPGARETSQYHVLVFGRPYGAIVAALRRAADRQRADIIGFNDMSVEAVAIDLQVPVLQAQLAKLREFSEPFRFIASDRGAAHRLLASLRHDGFGHVHHGRYVHTGSSVSYDAAAAALIRLFRRKGADITTVAFGDNASDARLLGLVDYPVIVQNDQTDATVALQRFVPAAQVTAIGTVPEWEAMVLDLADDCDRNRIRSR
jgi:mannosyl-3-phosphoglycerate phosphatase family protein